MIGQTDPFGLGAQGPFRPGPGPARPTQKDSTKLAFRPDLDPITHGLESFSDGAGAAPGHFVNALISGEPPSYEKLLAAASTTGTGYAWGKDALRVVDGDIDNQYDPAKKRIRVTPKK